MIDFFYSTIKEKIYMTTTDRILQALKKGMRVTRRTAIEQGWCENVTAVISVLRKKGYNILTKSALTPEGNRYTFYRLAA
jgi:repressor of nif and glnA expression|tara:strand:+ start:4288 stop:4527 length:240 start_codon:yes stop_codon:yes gene_type:complete